MEYLVYIFTTNGPDKCVGRVKANDSGHAQKLGLALVNSKGLFPRVVYVEQYDDACNETPWGETNSAF